MGYKMNGGMGGGARGAKSNTVIEPTPECWNPKFQIEAILYHFAIVADKFPNLTIHTFRGNGRLRPRGDDNLDPSPHQNGATFFAETKNM